MRLLLWLMLLTASVPSWAQLCVDPGQCQSQLMRLTVSNAAMNNVLNSSDRLQEVVLPALNTYVQSDAFRQSFVTDYPMEPMGFPYNVERCQREAERVSLNCEDPFLCSDVNVPADVRRAVCLNLPCALILGSQQMGQCPVGAEATPTHLHFPRPVGVRDLRINLLSATAENGRLRACFRMDALVVETGVEVEFDRDRGVTYDRMGIRNLRLELDGPREVCMSAAVNLSVQPPISDIRIETQRGENFVSNAMIDRAVGGSEVYGLSGYNAQTINVVKMTIAPAMARQFRPTIEDAVKDSLAEVFQEQIALVLRNLGGTGAPTNVETASDSFVSELGVGNLSVTKYVDLMDCALLKAAGTPIPASHACFAQTYPLYDNGNMRPQDVPTPARAARYLREQMARYDHVTSEALRTRLLAFESRMQTPANLANLYRAEIQPIANQIRQNQTRSQLVGNVGLLSNLGSRLSTFGVNLPEICDVVNPSPMRDRSIPNCPIQTYVDLNELNRLMATMYQSGRLCHRGRGDYVPELDSQGRQRYGSKDEPLGTGCLFMMEEDPDGMRCFLNGPPRLEYDAATQGYRVQLATRQCFRGGVFLGQGKIGGDINFTIGFRPSVCGGGDFCLENGRAEWNVVPGTARFALQQSSWFNGIVRRTIDDQLNKLVSSTIRLPLSSASGPMSMVPLEAEGRIDRGDGFFGACLKVKD